MSSVRPISVEERARKLRLQDVLDQVQKSGDFERLRNMVVKALEDRGYVAQLQEDTVNMANRSTVIRDAILHYVEADRPIDTQLRTPRVAIGLQRIVEEQLFGLHILERYERDVGITMDSQRHIREGIADSVHRAVDKLEGMYGTDEGATDALRAALSTAGGGTAASDDEEDGGDMLSFIVGRAAEAAERKRVEERAAAAARKRAEEEAKRRAQEEKIARAKEREERRRREEEERAAALRAAKLREEKEALRQEDIARGLRVERSDEDGEYKGDGDAADTSASALKRSGTKRRAPRSKRARVDSSSDDSDDRFAYLPEDTSVIDAILVSAPNSTSISIFI